jgi:EpsI family protein
MSREGLSIAVGVPVLLIFGALSWYVQLREPLEVGAHSLDEIPLQLDQWAGEDVSMDPKVVDMLDADYHLQRAYVHPMGDLVWLYVGYYGTDRGGRPEHTPWACYPSGGWTIVRSDVVDAVTLDGQDVIRANELLVEKAGERRLVHFWYQNHRKSGMLGGFDQAVERFVSRIRFGRADGSLVRLSTPMRPDEEPESARTRLRALGREVAPPLQKQWPSEAGADSATAMHIPATS